MRGFHSIKFKEYVANLRTGTLFDIAVKICLSTAHVVCVEQLVCEHLATVDSFLD